MIRNSLSGVYRGLGRLLRRSGNSAGGAEILDLGAPLFPSSAARLQDVTAAVVGPVAKYTVGPSWTNAAFETIGAAVAQVALDAPAGVPMIFVYQGTYTENVVVPESIPALVIAGLAGGPVLSGGPVLNGSLTWNMSATATLAALVGVAPNLGVTFNHPGSVARPLIRVSDCYFPTTSFLTINSVASTQGANVRINDTYARVAINGTAYQLLMVRGAWFEGGTFTTHINSRLNGVDMKGSFSTVVWNLNSNTSSWAVEGGCQIWGRLSLTGVGFNVRDSYIDYPGGPAITTNCTGSCFLQNNCFAHNAGGSPFAYIQNGNSLLHEGGNIFLEGATYPWYQLNAGTRVDRAESDMELRKLISVTGTVVLTPAQVGSQRRTTIYKTNGGGSVTLPAIATVEPGCAVPVVDGGNATASPWVVQGTGGELINGAATVPFSTNFQAREFQATTTGWTIIGAYL